MCKRKSVAVFLICTLAMLVPHLLLADTVILKSGRQIEGTIVEQTGTYIKIDYYGVPLTYFWEDVQSVNGMPGQDSTKVPGQSEYTTAASGEKILFQLQLAKGASYYLTMKTEQKIAQVISQAEQSMKQSITLGYNFNVIDVYENGNSQIEIRYDMVKMSQEGPTGTVEYDSAQASSEVPPAALMYSFLVGESFTMVLSPQAIIESVSGMEQVVDHIVEKMRFTQEEAQEAFRKNLQQQFGNQAVKESLTRSFAIFPDRAIGIGESWSKKLQLSAGAPIIMDTTYLFKDRKDGMIILDVYSKIEPNLEAESVSLGPLKVRYYLNGEQRGTIQMEEKTGWTHASTVSQKVSGRVEVEKSAEIPEMTSWPISIESAISLDSRKLN